MSDAHLALAELRQRHPVPDVHKPIPQLVERFGAEGEEMMRTLGSALIVVTHNEDIWAHLDDHDPMALRQARDAIEGYVTMAEEYGHTVNVFGRRNIYGHPFVAVGTAVNDVAEALETPKDQRGKVRWFRGTAEHGSDPRSCEVLAAVCGDGEVVVIGRSGDPEMNENEVRIEVLVGSEASAWAKAPSWGGGFWNKTELTEVTQ